MGASDAATIAAVAQRICANAERSRWHGPDIYDALWTPWPRPLTGGRRRRQAIIQLHARSPLDVRRLYRRRHPVLAKALAVFALAELRLHAAGGAPERLTAAGRALAALDADRAAGDAAWGYPFDMQTRWSYYARDTPNVVVTAFAADALHAGAEALEQPGYEQRARRAAAWMQDRLYRDELGAYVYHPGTRSVIHNANLLGASAAWRLLGDDAAVREAVRRAVGRTLDAQCSDGSFPYGESSNLAFVDSFHTGYVLDGLCDLADADPRVPGALERGAAYYRERFFDERGRGLLWPDRRYPEDAHSAGTGLTVLARLADRGLVHESLVARVAQRAVTHMAPGGRAVHRRHRWGRTRVRYLRWCDSHLALGLANAAELLARRDT